MTERNIEQLLAWYANGTLDSAEREQVEKYLSEHPEMRLQLAEYEFLQETVGEIAADEPQLQSDNFDNLMAQIDELETTKPVVSKPEAVTETPAGKVVEPSWVQRLTEWVSETLQWGVTPAFARVAVVAQFALVAVLGGALLLPSEEPGYEVLSGQGSGPTVTQGVLVDIGLKPELTLAEFQQLLRDQQATVTSGPNALGVYRISLVEDGQLSARLTALQNHAGVIYLQRVQP